MFFFLSLKLLVTLEAMFAPKVVTMMSSVSAVMEACGAGSLEMILGWNTLNGFLGNCSCKQISFFGGLLHLVLK